VDEYEDHYRKKALEAAVQAKSAKTEADKADWLRLEKGWLVLAAKRLQVVRASGARSQT
jgi:hypothetical protein